MRKQKEARLHQIVGDLNDPRLESALNVVGWLKVLNLLIEGLALSSSVEWGRLQWHRLGFSPNSIDLSLPKTISAHSDGEVRLAQH